MKVPAGSTVVVMVQFACGCGGGTFNRAPFPHDEEVEGSITLMANEMLATAVQVRDAEHEHDGPTVLTEDDHRKGLADALHRLATTLSGPAPTDPALN
jgi:hypothetical protein